MLGADDLVRCPVDELDFRPYFTDGACPLCGWRPDDVQVGSPWTHRLDWAVAAFAILVAMSVVMAIVVFVAL